jgi:Ca2+:H+ antiporter
MFAIAMIIIGGMAGGSLLLGGWRHNEQHYNLQSANAYLGVIISITVFALVLPNFTITTPGPTLSYPQQLFLCVMSVELFCAFLAIQTGRHRSYFISDGNDPSPPAVPHAPLSLYWHGGLLLVYILPVVLLAEQLAHPIDYFIETLHAPEALGGGVIAMLVATPEAMAATRSAMANHMQRSINIALGSVLATIGLTVPAMLAVSYVTGREVHLGLEKANNLLLLLTLAVSVVALASGRTNILQGAVHVVLFAAFVMLIFQD